MTVPTSHAIARSVATRTTADEATFVGRPLLFRGIAFGLLLEAATGVGLWSLYRVITAIH